MKLYLTKILRNNFIFLEGINLDNFSFCSLQLSTFENSLKKFEIFSFSKNTFFLKKKKFVYNKLNLMKKEEFKSNLKIFIKKYPNFFILKLIENKNKYLSLKKHSLQYLLNISKKKLQILLNFLQEETIKNLNSFETLNKSMNINFESIFFEKLMEELQDNSNLIFRFFVR